MAIYELQLIARAGREGRQLYRSVPMWSADGASRLRVFAIPRDSRGRRPRPVDSASPRAGGHEGGVASSRDYISCLLLSALRKRCPQFRKADKCTGQAFTCSRNKTVT